MVDSGSRSDRMGVLEYSVWIRARPEQVWPVYTDPCASRTHIQTTSNLGVGRTRAQQLQDRQLARREPVAVVTGLARGRRLGRGFHARIRQPRHPGEAFDLAAEQRTAESVRVGCLFREVASQWPGTGAGIWPSTFEADHVPGQATMPVTDGQSLLPRDLHHGLWGMDEGPEVVASHPAQQVVPADHKPGDRIGRRV